MIKNNFDFLRFAFAFIVVVSHAINLSGVSDFKFLNPFFDTHLSVTGFFIISGYLIAQSFDKTNNVLTYYIKRAKRILPAYIFVIFISIIGLSFFSTFSIIDYFSNTQVYRYLVFNLLFLNFLEPCLPGVFVNNYLCSVNGALWTIKVEVAFYLILPFIFYLIKKTARPVLVYIFVYLFSLLYQGLLIYLITLVPAKSNLFNTLLHQLPGFLTYFVSGIFLFKYADSLIKYKKTLILVSLPIFIIEYYYDLEILRPISMAILIVSFAFGVKYFNNFGQYGDFSYGIYIYHFPLIQIMVALGLFSIMNPYYLVFLILILVILISIFSWNFIEKRYIVRYKK